MPIQPIILTRRADPFDDPAWAFELKLDGFRFPADTIDRRVLGELDRQRRATALSDSAVRPRTAHRSSKMSLTSSLSGGSIIG